MSNTPDQLSFYEVMNNSAALQSLIHTICKQQSKSDAEFNVKYDVYEKLQSTYNRWGYGGQFTTLVAFSTYCLKGYNPRRKLLVGLLYVYWINHFFTFGAFFGVSSKLPWAIKKLNQAETPVITQQMQLITKLIRERNGKSDSQLSSEFYEQTNGQIVEESILTNDFFLKNKQYIPKITVCLPYQICLLLIQEMVWQSWSIRRVKLNNLMKLLLLLSIILFICLCKKKRDPLSVRPNTFDKYIYCNACQAIVRESLKKLRDTRSESEIADQLSRICRNPFKGYAYTGQSIQLGCDVFMGGWLDQLEEQLIIRVNNEDFEHGFCVEYTQACLAVDPLEVQEYRKKMHELGRPVEINGKLYMPNNEGHVDLSVQYEL